MTARPISAVLASLALAALLAAPSTAAPAPAAVRAVSTLPSLADAGRTATPGNAIVSTSDTFLVASHGFDDLAGVCRTRGWVGEDRTSQVYAHVATDRTVNQAFFTGLAPVQGVDNLTGSLATTRLHGGRGIVVGDSGAVLVYDEATGDEPYPLWRMFAAYPGTDVVRLFAQGMRVTTAVFDRANHRVIAHSGGLGLYVLRDGAEPVLLGGTGLEHERDTTLAAFNIQCNGLAMDGAGNIYFSDLMGNRVRKVTPGGLVVTVAGTGGRGFSGDGGPAVAATLDQPIGLAVDDTDHVLYIADYHNLRVRRVDLVTGTITTAAGDGTAETLPEPSWLAASGGNLYISASDERVYRLAGGVLARVAGGGTTFAPAAGSLSPVQQDLRQTPTLASDGADGVYLRLETLRLVLHLTAAGQLTPVAGVTAPIVMGDHALWFGADAASHPAEVADWVRPAGYGNGWSQRVTSPEFDFGSHPNAVFRFDGFLELHDNGSITSSNANSWVQVQALNTSGIWQWVHARVTEVGGGESIPNGPFVGNARFKGEVHLNADGNETLSIAPLTRLRVIVQTEASGSDEDGLGLDHPDGALVLDNLTVRDSVGDLIAPTDFEDGTTGAWTLSARNGAYRLGTMVSIWTRDLPTPASPPQLAKGFDFTDPGCVWTFLAAGDTLNHRGLYARMTSPWFAMAPGDTQLLVAFSGKLGTRNSGRQLACWVRGKNAGDAHPRFAAPTFFVYNSGTWGDDVSSPYINQRVLRFPQDFQVGAPGRADSVQVVFYAEDQSEADDPGFFPTGYPPLADSKLPFLDDIRLYQLDVDRDHDGVADALDACPDSCAAGQDADADGCVDPTATMRHVESWDRSALPLHYRVSALGDPRITDGSDLAVITNGFAAWTTAPGTNLQFVQDPLTTQTNASAYDGVNLVTFQDDYAFPPNVIGITPTLSALRRAAWDDHVVLPGQIVDADLILNPQVPFRTATYNPGAGSIDLLSVVTHEAGHLLGLCHSGVLNSTMFFVLQPGTGAASLEADDRAAIAAAYPGPTFATAFGTITGHVVRGGGAGPGGAGSAIPGALVTAVRLTGGGAIVDTVASDYTDEGGNYALRGLQPGSYSVRVTPLDGEVGGYALTPDYISARLQAVAQSDFSAEWWSQPETDRDPPDLRGLLTLAAGESRAGIDVVTNVDTIAPTVVSVAPGRDTTGIHIDTSILVNFSERIDPNTLQGGLRLHPAGSSGSLGGSATLVNGARSLVFNPTSALLFDTQYEIDVTTALADRQGVHVAQEFSTRFTTEPAPPVTITDIQPRAAAVGSLITILGTGFDPAGTDSVGFYYGLHGYPLPSPIAAANVTPTTMLVRVPSSAVPGPVTVTVDGVPSNSFSFIVLPTLPLTAPAHVADVTLSFAPTDVAVAPDGTRAFAVGSGGLAEIDLSTLAVTYASIGAARSVATRSNGDSLVITRSSAGDVVVVDEKVGSGTRGQVVGSAQLPAGARAGGIALTPSGRSTFVSDPGTRVVYRVDTDPRSATRNQVVGEAPDSAAALSGGIAATPDGAGVLYGTLDSGLRLLPTIGIEPSPWKVASSAGGIAVSPTGTEALLAGTGVSAGGLTAVKLGNPDTPSAQDIVLGGEVRDAVFTPDAKAAYAVNSAFSLIQMVDMDSTSARYHTRVAEVGTGSAPTAISVSAFGSVVAVANYGSRSVSVYHTGGSATLVRAVPAVARPGDVVALQGTGGPFGAGSQVDVGGGPFAPARRAPGGDGAAFVVPAGPQRDASVAVVDSTGARTLGLLLGIVDPIAVPVARETGFGVMLDSVALYSIYRPTTFTTMNISPDGKLIAITRDLDGAGEDLDLVRVGEDGVNRLGTKLYDRQVAPAPDNVLGAAFSADGRFLWICNTDLFTIIIDSDPASPMFGQNYLAWGAGVWGVGPIAADPLGRYMVVGDYANADSLFLYTPTGTPVGAINAPGWIGALAVSPDGHWVVAAGAGRTFFGDLDTFADLPPSSSHVTASGRGYAIAIPHDGKRAVVKYPDLSIGIYNLDASAGTVGAELYYGSPLTVGVPVQSLVPAPDGHSVLISRPGATLVQLDPSVVPPTVTSLATERPVGPMTLSADGCRLWTEAGAGTTRDSLRLASLSRTTSLALVSGGGQSGLANTILPQPLKFRATDGLGDPQVGAVIRFDGVHGLLPILDSWDTPLWHITDANGEVAVRWRVSSAPSTDSLVARVLGATGASVLATAQVVLADSVLPPLVVALGPADGASGLNAGTAVSATFNKAVDSASVAAKMRLYTGINPVAGSFRVSQDGKVFFFQPAQALAFAARCSLVVAPGVLDHYALATTQGLTAAFTIQAPPAIGITSLSPPAAAAGTPVVIGGQGFSPVASQNTVLFNGVLATVTSATATSIVANVPLAATTGAVTVQSGGGTSNALEFVVLDPNASPGGVIGDLPSAQGVRAVAITSDGNRAYVTNPASNSVTALDIPGARTITSITVGLQPQGLGLLPDDSRAYVANTGSNDVSVIDIRPASADYHKVVATIPVGTAPIGVAVSALGPRVVVVNSGSHDASLIDANPGNATFDQVTATANTGSAGQSVIIAPDGARAFVATSGGTVVVIDMLTGAVTATANTGSAGQSVAITPDGALLLVLCQDGTIQIIDVSPGSPTEYQVTATANAGSGAQTVVVTPDGALAYVTSADGNSVLVFTITSSNLSGAASISPGPAVTLTLVATLPVGRSPSGIAVDPSHGGFALVCNSGSGTVSLIRLATTQPPVAARLELEPDWIVLAMLGHWTTGYIEPAAPFLATDIVLRSIRLNGVVPADTTQGGVIGDHDHDGVPDLRVEFDRRALALAVPDGLHVPVTVTGSLGARSFAGTDTIRVVRFEVTAPAAGSLLAPRQNYTVRWQAPGLMQFLWVAVLHSFDRGATWKLDATHLHDTGSYAWSVPDTLCDSVYVAVVLVERDDSNGSEVYGVLGVSDPFRIGGALDFEAAPTVLTFAPIRPNPAQGGALMRFGLPRSAEASLQVFDIAGRRVRTLVQGPQVAGWHDVRWSGHDESGGRVGPGLYFVRFRAEGREFKQRLVWLR